MNNLYNTITLATRNSLCNAVSSYTTSDTPIFRLSEFIRQLSNDPAYDIVYNTYNAYWKYDVDSDITYEAYFNTLKETIRLRIFEGYKVIDTMYFERLNSTNGFIWEEIIK